MPIFSSQPPARKLYSYKNQDCPGATWSSLQRLADDFREAGEEK